MMRSANKIKAKSHQKILIAALFAAALCSWLVMYAFVKNSKVANDIKVIKAAFWGSRQEKEIITNIVRDWEKNNPDVKVDLRHTIPRDYTSRILTQIAGRVAPDVVFAEVNVFVTLYEKGMLLDLTQFLKKDDDINAEDFFSEIMNRFTVDGRIYGIPRDIAPIACVYYNKRLFDEAGIPYPRDSWGWNDFLRTAIRLTKKDKTGKIRQYGVYGWTWQNFIYANGGRIVDNVEDPKKCLLDSPESVQGFKNYTDLFLTYKASPLPHPLDRLGMGAHELFKTQKIAMFLSGIWDVPVFRKIKDFDWDIAMFPKGPAGIRAFATGGSGYCILKTTKYPEEAWRVVKCLAGKKGQKMLAREGLAQPAIRKIAEGSDWAGSPDKPLNKGMLNDAVKYIVFDPFHRNWQEALERHIYPKLDLVFNGDSTPKEAFEKITPKINELLRQVPKMKP